MRWSFSSSWQNENFSDLEQGLTNLVTFSNFIGGPYVAVRVYCGLQCSCVRYKSHFSKTKNIVPYGRSGFVNKQRSLRHDMYY